MPHMYRPFVLGGGLNGGRMPMNIENDLGKNEKTPKSETPSIQHLGKKLESMELKGLGMNTDIDGKKRKPKNIKFKI